MKDRMSETMSAGNDIHFTMFQDQIDKEYQIFSYLMVFKVLMYPNHLTCFTLLHLSQRPKLVLVLSQEE